MPEIALVQIVNALNRGGAWPFLENVARQEGAVRARSGLWQLPPTLDPTPWLMGDSRHAHSLSAEDRAATCQFRPRSQYIQDVSPYLINDSAADDA